MVFNNNKKNNDIQKELWHRVNKRDKSKLLDYFICVTLFILLCNVLLMIINIMQMISIVNPMLNSVAYFDINVVFNSLCLVMVISCVVFFYRSSDKKYINHKSVLMSIVLNMFLLILSLIFSICIYNMQKEVIKGVLSAINIAINFFVAINSLIIVLSVMTSSVANF